MISMHGVPSSLILRNESWVRKQAHSLARRLPSNVERADLIQVGLIAVAQSALAFEWEGDRETEEARNAFVRYAHRRVKGAMLDELRQMDQLGRSQRRLVKIIQVAKERWRTSHATDATASDISELTRMSVEQIFELEQAACSVHIQSLSDSTDSDDGPPAIEPATERDEVEARVETGMLLRRLEPFFAKLPERERKIIDAYLGIGLSPVKLAESMNISQSRMSQLFGSVCKRIEVHQGHAASRASDRTSEHVHEPSEISHAWTEPLQRVLMVPTPGTGCGNNTAPLLVDSTTRWG
jgi:RNA polymerase sigma factor for flagellar operon FliA